MPMMASFGQFWYPIGASREHVSFIICLHDAINHATNNKPERTQHQVGQSGRRKAERVDCPRNRPNGSQPPKHQATPLEVAAQEVQDFCCAHPQQTQDHIPRKNH